MEHVDEEPPRRRPVIHRLPSDQCQTLVDTDLRELGILDRVWPPPEHLPLVKARNILQSGFGQQHDVAGGNDLLTRTNSRDLLGKMRLGDAETVAIAPLQKHPRPQVRIDSVEVLRMDRQPELVFLA
jgi:hypothetical protein